jgi:hypothetical protein
VILNFLKKRADRYRFQLWSTSDAEIALLDNEVS